ncbi:MAG: sulfotransferase [Xanthomonadales bacterium]|nr:sulfotransferase [Xanthomonadales bacterium]
MKNIEDTLSQSETAEEHFSTIKALDELVAAEPDNLDHRFKLGLSCLQVGQVERAESLFRSCIESGFDSPKLQLNLGHALKALGRTEGAVACYKGLIEADDDARAAIAYWSLANMKDYQFSDEEIVFLRGRVQTTDAQPGYRGLLLFTLAFAREQQGLYHEAYMSMCEANMILAMHRPFQGEQYGMLVKALLKTGRNLVAAPERDGPTPIFVVGMPRSGTTLVEQILASHSNVEATDELPYLERLAIDMDKSDGYARSLATLSTEQKLSYANRYLEKVEPYRQRQLDYFIDKNPANFLHIGLIKVLFPGAKIINVVRDPLDNAMAVFKQYFNRGNEYSYSLQGIIFYWQGYLTLMKHWEELYPGEILHLGYEDLVNEPEGKITDILEYCGLPVEPECFRFYESDRPVLTPSASQVRNPISNRAVDSGKKYEKHIKAVIPALAEIKRKCREVLGV